MLKLKFTIFKFANGSKFQKSERRKYALLIFSSFLVYKNHDIAKVRVDHEKDLGIMTTINITWDLHVNTVVAKANKMLGILKRTCTSITDITIRRTLYLSLVKSQLLYASEVWSPVNNVKLAKRVEKVQRRATKWILMNGDITYKERLLSLNLLPLSYDREIEDLTFFYKALFGFVNVDLSNFVSFVNHGRTRLSRFSEKNLQTPLCKTTTFQSSYYNRIVKIWNTVTQEYLPKASLDLVLLNVI